MLLICRSRTYMLSVVATMLLLLLIHSAVAQTMIPASGDNIFAEDDAPFDRQISGLSKCSQTSLELWGLGPNDPLEPCILYDIGASATGSVGENPARSTTVTLVQVTPSRCHDHRDGVVTGVIKLNEANEGRGIAIGHFKDFHVKFKLITVIAGNTDYLDSAEYDRRHVDLLNGMVETYQPQYIVGTCSWKASLEPAIALQHQKMLMAQVGPPGYYTDEGNPYVFGFHINSDNYPLPAMQNVRFHAARHGGAQKQPIRVVYRNKSEFFKSTCRSVVKEAKKSGFTDLLEIEFDPFADDDGDGDTNSFDEDFLKDIADQACPPGSDQEDFHPAIFVCSIVEQDILLERWRENGCRPVSLWMTTATWAWTASNLGSVPYIQGGGQWHEAFTYSDDYFSSGSELLSYNEEQFGYRGTYDVVAGYSMAILFSQHIVASYRADNDPLIQTDFFNDDGYEILRRKLLVLTADTLFGPFSLNRFKRNIGRGAAGTQWLPKKSNSNSTLQEYDNKCISPLQQAESAGVMPAMAASLCAAGEFLSLDKIQKEEAILTGKCNLCPVDTISLLPNSDQQCNKCVVGAITEGQEGQSACIGQNPNLLTPGIKILGYAFAGISWFLALFFLVWLCIHRNDPVVRISQIEFLILICVGAVISSSSIVALNYEADVGEDTTAATKACMAVPFLYTIGWVLQYASLCAKSYRLHKVTNAPSFHRVKVTAFSMFHLIAVALLCDLIVVVVWTLISPLEYEREVTGTHWDAPNGLITVISVGECRNSSDVSVWAFVGPLIFLHIILMISTNFLLWKNRGVEDRYQESRYVAMASVYVFEILVIGIPVLVAVGDDSRAKYIVFCAIVFLNDVGILCLIFIPKMLFVRQGLPEGVSVSESVGRKSMQDAVRRQSVFVLKTGNSSGLMSKKLGSSNSLTVSDPKLAVLEHTDDGDERDHSGRLSGGPYMVSGSYIDDKSLIAAVSSGTPQIKTKNDDGVVLETYEIDAAAAAAATTEGDMLSTTSATNETMEDSLSYLKDDSQMLGDRAIVIPPTTNKGALSTTSSTDEMLEDSAVFAEEDSHSDNIIANIAKDV